MREQLEFQGPQTLAPAVGWLATLTFGLASLNLKAFIWWLRLCALALAVSYLGKPELEEVSKENP